MNPNAAQVSLRIVLLLAPIALTPMLAACVKTSAQPAPPPPPQVTVANVIERDVTEWDEFTGRLQAVDSVEIRPRVSGYVAAVRFSEGAMVRRGETPGELRTYSVRFSPRLTGAAMSGAKCTLRATPQCKPLTFAGSA